MHLISNDILQKTLHWQLVLQTLDDAFKQLADKPEYFQNPERVAIQQGNNSYLTMPCTDAEGWFGVKQVSVIPNNPQRNLPSIQAWYTLSNPTGTPVLACDATVLTRIRTSAVSALAASYLAPRDAKHLLIIGTGALAPWMAQAHAHVREYTHVTVWGRSLDKAKTTAEIIQQSVMQRNLDNTLPKITVTVSNNLAVSINDADVISAATTARDAIIQGAWLSADKAQHIDLVGAFLPDMVEADATTIKNSHVVVDTLESCQSEAGDLIQAAQQGWQWSDVVGDLSAIVSGKTRVPPHTSTLFKSVGLALEDLVVAKQLI